MDMVYPVTSCLMAIVALIFGIYYCKSMDNEVGISSNWRPIAGGRCDPSLSDIWIINMELIYYLVIFVFALFFVYCFYFYFFSINNFCWTYRLQSCFIAVLATGIGIGLLFYQQYGNYYNYLSLMPKLKGTNTWLECFFELFLLYMCYFCEIFSFWFCFYIRKLCKRITYWVGYKKKKKR